MQVEQIDREAAADNAVLAEFRAIIREGRADHHAEPFARHRLAERAKIVAWLREQDGHGYDDMRANCIEAGEHYNG